MKYIHLIFFLACLLSGFKAQACSAEYLYRHLTFQEDFRPACANSSSAPLQEPVLMVSILDKNNHLPPQPAMFKPYEGVLARSPYLGVLGLICACLLPLGMLVVTLGTVFDYRQKRRETELVPAWNSALSS
ncbi:hypothetical protein [Undibacterium sp. TS12]|uniref:hypothetical protein n=1 Tax=Undibacterium sp. TS12 TaxID=2908202 RepID=UPI001F4C6C9A|nr:hypothetical protein [Undibacterium sp. TS12]MCH8622060.1 hypothetical protein [Undibacterium sp. TS12]